MDDVVAARGANSQVRPDAGEAAAAAKRPADASARHVLDGPQAWTAAAVLAAVAAAAARWPDATIQSGHAVLLAAFFAMIAIRIAAAGALAAPRPMAAGAWRAPLPTYTILCPLYREAAVAAQLAEALMRLDYPCELLDVKLIVERDDDATQAALRALTLPPWWEVVTAPDAGPRTKPKALNVGLARARGAFTCIYDAEDDPDPRQLRAALDAFAAGGARLGCVQAPLEISNGAACWLAGQFAAEYAIQFRELIPFYARAGLPFPLGGTSNHFRTAALRAVGGWDPYNVTEDAEIGYRLAQHGWRLGFIAPPTREDAPITLRAWVRQRSRWIKGHLQTWLVLMRRPRRTFAQLGPGGFLAMQVQLGGGLVAAFAHAPFAAALVVSLLTPGRAVGVEGWCVAAAGYATAAYGALVGAIAARDASLARAALTMPLYWPLSTVAATRALVELAFAPHYWAKTDHLPRSARAVLSSGHVS